MVHISLRPRSNTTDYGQQLPNLPRTALSLSLSVAPMPIFPNLRTLTDDNADSVDKILARFNDAGQFDELETVWFLIA